MIVYIVIESDGYDYHSIEKVFSSRESADAFASQKPYNQRLNNSGDGYYVEAHEVLP